MKLRNLFILPPQGTTKNIDIASVDKRLHEVRGLHERLMLQLTNVQDKTAVILKGTPNGTVCVCVCGASVCMYV